MSAGTNRSIPTPVSVPNGGTGLAAGTSGGIPAYTGATTIASSGVLAASALVIGGGAGVAPSTTTTGAGVLVANINRPVFATTATAAGTTTLTVTSAATQEATGSTTQTYTLPVVTTLVAGWATLFINKSTGNVTLNSSGSNSIVVLASGQSVTLVLKSIAANATPTAWDVVGLSPRLWLAAQKSGSQTLAVGSSDVATPFQTILGGTMQSAWNTTTGQFTAPITGLLKISGLAQGYSQSQASYQEGYYELNIKRSGTVIASLIACVPTFDSNSTYYYMNENPNSCVAVTAGDVLSVVSSWYDNNGILLIINVESQIQLEYLQ